MVLVSKPLFDAACAHQDCHLMMHPWHESCVQAVLPLFMDSVVGSAKFYAIIYAAQIAMRGKKMLKKEEWLKMGSYYVRSTLLGLMVTTSAPPVSCAIRPEDLLAKISSQWRSNSARHRGSEQCRRWWRDGVTNWDVYDEAWVCWLSTEMRGGTRRRLLLSVWTQQAYCNCYYHSNRKLLGNKYHYYTYLWLPFSLTGLYIYLEPPSRRGLVINLFCNLFIEYWLRNLQHAGYLSLTKTQQTLMFMLGSSLLFYLMRLEREKKQQTPLFWLYTPEKVRRKDDSSNNVCPHDGSCEKYIAKGYASYFGVGLGISLARVILPKLKSPIRAISSIRGKHFKLALFFGSYIGIYRAVVCYLCRKTGHDSALFALPAGYLAGISFLFSPALGLSIASVTGAFKLYSTILYEKKILPTNIPLPELMYCICQGTLFNARILHQDTCPGYVFNLIRSVSNGRSEFISENFNDVIKRALAK